MALRVTRQQVEVAGAPAAANLRVSRQAILVLYTESVSSTDLTAESILTFTDTADTGLAQSLTAENTVVLVQQALRQSTELTATSTVVLVSSADVDDSIDRTAASSITLSDSADRAGSFSPAASNSLSLTQATLYGAVPELTASNTIGLTQDVVSSLFVLTAGSTLELTDLAHSAGELIKTAQSELVIIQESDLNLTVLTAGSTLELEQTADRIRAKATGVDRTASDTLGLTQEADRIIALASGITLTSTSTINLVSQGNLPIFRSGTSALALTQSADLQKVHSASNTLSLSHSVVLNRALNITASSTLVLGSSFTFESSSLSDKKYSPQVGSGSSPIRTTPPILTRRTDVQLYYPTTGAPVYSLTLKTPDFGNRDRNAYSRVNRESRGGTLQIYSDPKWPATRTLLLGFSRLKKDEAVALQEFFQNTLGLEIGFRDWESRVWHGIILDPDTPLIHNVRAGVDISFELMAELADSTNQVSQISLTQSASVEVM